MMHDLLAREIVERDRVAVAAARRLRDAARRAVRLRLGQYQAASTLVPSVLSGRIEWVLLHSSYCQSAILPSASSDALTLIAIAAP